MLASDGGVDEYLESQKDSEPEPTNTTSKPNKAPSINTDICAACEECIYVCPTSAIVVLNGYPTINAKNCIHCDSCISTCPLGAIS